MSWRDQRNCCRLLMTFTISFLTVSFLVMSVTTYLVSSHTIVGGEVSQEQRPPETSMFTLQTDVITGPVWQCYPISGLRLTGPAKSFWVTDKHTHTHTCTCIKYGEQLTQRERNTTFFNKWISSKRRSAHTRERGTYSVVFYFFTFGFINVLPPGPAGVTAKLLAVHCTAWL